MNEKTNNKELNSVGVVGAGTMGIGICEVAAAHGQKVVLFDVNNEQAKTALTSMQARLKKRVIKGKITQQQASEIASRIEVVDDLAHFSGCDLVVEAVIEDLKIKQELFKTLEIITSSEALLATNTSSISITAIAAAMKDPSRLFGMHFFNPAPVMKLVEIISGKQTNSAYLKQAKAICKSWQKVAVMAQSTPGFIVNRVARSYYGEPLKMLQEGLSEFHQIDAVMTAAGFRMGPFALMDLIGIDINYAVSQTVYEAMFNDPRFRPSLIQGEMVNANQLGKKTQQGFYNHRPGAANPKPEYLYSDATFDSLVVPEEETFFSKMFCDFEYDQRKWHGDQVIVSGCELRLSDGRLAREIEKETNQAVCLVDVSFDYKKSQAVNLCFSPGVNQFMKNRIVACFNHMGKNVIETPDQPALIALRTVVMLINEAADAVFNGVCSAKDVDLSMRYGVNYPKGLLAFGEELGWSLVAQTLQRLFGWFGDDRYRLSPYIRNQL
ncbi:3-hydroxyacyl-CoA dehydrogenase [Marinicella sp. S1101]|uniref:3-hydroxyacyl-CoA dehydrogenase n=1 Tax=Marinicella marina TaxID=2996016 RepID=UPI002260BD5F|nr:3-hydroxyacyl-CoA dehydrogenase [Marinicella marina]MCX7554088.1 3-hydroxyacyl-CoA dehydrogenase [Marinicella marina]MDJ1141219.1 3-hydroxyacyl-CoA dehydrogenase [Marinicella marina]